MRKTNHMVYVDKATRDDPDALFDAVYAHLTHKGCPVPKRKKFMSLYVRAHSPATQMAVINDWVQVRDIATFPFRKADEAGVQAAEAGSKLKMGIEGDPVTGKTLFNAELVNEGTGDPGGVSMDDGTDGEPESGVAPE